MVTAEDRDAAEQPIGQAQSLAPLGEAGKKTLAERCF